MQARDVKGTACASGYASQRQKPGGLPGVADAWRVVGERVERTMQCYRLGYRTMNAKPREWAQLAAENCRILPNRPLFVVCCIGTITVA